MDGLHCLLVKWNQSKFESSLQLNLSNGGKKSRINWNIAGHLEHVIIIFNANVTTK